MENRARPARWSWKLGELFGVSIRVHITFLALLLWVLLTSPIRAGGVRELALQWFLVIAVFAIIVIHELGHALVARRFGSVTREILLLPIGGVASMDRMPVRPGHELLVAVAGPAVNIVLAMVLGLAIGAWGLPFDPEQPTNAGAMLVQLFWINVGLAVFNLVPAFPMDGGRILRALLAMRLGRDRATRIAGTVGRVLAAGFVLVGLMVNPMLALIGVFVWLAGSQEAATVEMQAIVAGATVADAMIRTSQTVEADEPLEATAGRMLADGQHQLAVTDHGRLAGVVTVSDLATELAARGPQGPVGAAMHRDVPVIESTAPLASALERLDRGGVALVVDDNALVGLLTVEQIAAYAALHHGGRPGPAQLGG